MIEQSRPICMHVCVCACVYVCICIQGKRIKSANLCACACTFACGYVCLLRIYYIHMHIYAHTHTQQCTCIYRCIYIHTQYIHTHLLVRNKHSFTSLSCSLSILSRIFRIYIHTYTPPRTQQALSRQPLVLSIYPLTHIPNAAISHLFGAHVPNRCV
jgi:hypothetical protein